MADREMKCGKCGAFVSLKNRWLQDRTTGILIVCRRCKAILSVSLEETIDKVK